MDLRWVIVEKGTMKEREGVEGMTVRILFYNRPGVLVHLIGLFSNPGFNIDNMAVSPTEDPGLSQLLITIQCHPAELQLILKQIEKLRDVIEIQPVDLDQLSIS